MLKWKKFVGSPGSFKIEIVHRISGIERIRPPQPVLHFIHIPGMAKKDVNLSTICFPSFLEVCKKLICRFNTFIIQANHVSRPTHTPHIRQPKPIHICFDGIRIFDRHQFIVVIVPHQVNQRLRKFLGCDQSWKKVSFH